MDYRHPDGHILRTSRTRMITVQLEGHDRPGSFPSTILDKQPPEVLDRYGYRRIVYGPKADPAYWNMAPQSDLSTPGVEHITYEVTPKYTAAQVATAMLERYEKIAGPVIETIRSKIAFYAAIGRATEEAAWQALYDQARPMYQGAVAAYQAAVALPTEAERYQAFIALYQSLGDHVVQLPE